MSCSDPKSNLENTFRILVATDCHLGYEEKDPIRGNDSMVTFEEILATAKKRDVDLILFAGDLYHANKPSRKVIHDSMVLLRKYCFGDKPIQFQVISQPSDNFGHCSFQCVNYEDSNYNVAIPVFSIHGNHDDPIGSGNLCCLDLLSAAGLVNYFGKFNNLENIELSPILMQKGETKLALYGMGSLKDERLHRLMRDGKVSLLCPPESESEYFNLMLIHQNRIKHGATNYIPEEFLDELLDLVIWGHEHECRIDPEFNERQKFFVSQPGSSVATSLCFGESVPKHIGLLEIQKKEFRMIKIPLKTVRRMYVEDIDLSKAKINYDLKVSENVMEYCKSKMEDLLLKASKEHSGFSNQPDKPLIRLRVEYTKEDEIFNKARFGHLYNEKVANPKDVVLFRKRRTDKDYKFTDIVDDVRELFRKINSDVMDSTRVEDVVREFFEDLDADKQLMLLSEKGLAFALQEFVVKEENTSIAALIQYQLKKVQTFLRTKGIIDEDSIYEQVTDFKVSQKENDSSKIETKMGMDEFRSRLSNRNFDSDSDQDTVDINTNVSQISRGKRGRGGARGRARGSRSTASSKGRGSKALNSTAESTSNKSIKTMFKSALQQRNDWSDDNDDAYEYDSDEVNELSSNNSKRMKMTPSFKNPKAQKKVSSDLFDCSGFKSTSSPSTSSNSNSRKRNLKKGLVYF